MTFAEMQNALNQARFHKAILSHIVEHLDAEFLPALDQQPKKALLTDEKVLVPQDAFEFVITNLNNWLKSCQQQEQTLLGTSILVEQPKQEPAPEPEKQPETPQEQPVTPPSEAQP